MMKKLLLSVLVVLMTTACAAEGPNEPISFESVATEAVTVSEAPIIPTEEPAPEVRTEMSGGECYGQEPVEVTINVSLSQTIAGVIGSEPSSTSTCFGLFNITHGAWTHLLYVTDGQAMLNLPVEIFHPYEGDTFLVGDPELLSEKLAVEGLIDSDTMIVEGGLIQVTKAGEMVDLIDWSEVSGGRFVNLVRFESSRLNLVNNQRTWTGYCNGQVYMDMAEAVACGLQGNEGW